ncbi:MAG: cell surface protein [Eubacterium sp.]|nr:cell surface protein [Eubacterium sp.]
MRYSKRYIFFTIVLFLLILAKFNNSTHELVEIESFRGARLKQEDWNPLIAASVNGKDITLKIGSRTYTSKDTPMYMDEQLQLMIPVSILRDSLDCSAHIYDRKKLILQKRDLSVSFALGEQSCKVNDKMENLRSPMAHDGEEFFVGMEDVAQLLGYDYEWDMPKNEAVSVDTMSTTSFLPYKYDLREQQRVSAVKDQGPLGTCWAFATLTALESSLLPEQEAHFAEDHMTLNNSFHQEQNDGGDYTMSMAYLASWQGPVRAADDPYGDGVTDPSLQAVCHVQEMQVMESGDLQKIKEAVFKYGGVQTSIYTTLQNSSSTSVYYNSQTNAYCYQGSEKSNHDVVIIGWDDSFAKENFSTPPEEDGAFICQNSWGAEFGEDGIFYISYYDSNIGIHNVVYTKVESVDNYDSIYQSDLCGWVGQMGYDRESIYGANVFRAKSKEQIEAAGFYATGKDTTYDIYVVKNFKDTTSLEPENRIKVAQGQLSNAGYYTIPFTKPVEVERGERFAIMLYLTTPNAVYPMAIEYAADELTQEVDITDGEGYISIRGSKWNRVEEQAKSNLCIKAFSSAVTTTTDENDSRD